MADYATQLPQHTLAVVEATGNWSYMYDVLKPYVDTVVLAHPKQVRVIAAAKVKTDKIDATTLAHLARADLLPMAYAPPTRNCPSPGETGARTHPTQKLNSSALIAVQSASAL